ncbi:MAG: serine/threonine-protein kinase [Candidatus ainarchaeum sp.]|nr:serine/threonine-protein kinase [Candidatus ainarchaeum sp.]
MKDPLVGKTVPNRYHPEQRYRIEALLGSGGNAKVYRAVDQTTENPVALKFAPTLEEIRQKANLSNTEALAQQKDIYLRFMREAETLKNISYPPLGHSNVVKVYGAGGIDVEGSAEPLPYMAMELIDGMLLPQLLENGPILWPDTKSIFLQVCDALTYVHQKGILHRDLKWNNVVLKMLSEDLRKLSCETYHATLIDFGSVLLPDARTMTISGATLGTMPYMSPEQLNNSHNVTVRSEVYSLGCMLYEIITGSLPFVSQEQVPLMTSIMQDKPESPRKRAPDRGIPRQLCAIALTALEKKPENRYPDVRALAAAISSVKWNDKGPRKTLHPILWLTKHPRTFGLAIGATALVAAGSGFCLYNHFRTPEMAATPAPAAMPARPLTEPPIAEPADSGGLKPEAESTAVDSLKPKPETLSTTMRPPPYSNPYKLKKPAKRPPAAKKDTLHGAAKRPLITPHLRYNTPQKR